MSCVNRATAHDNGKLPFSPAMWLCPEINFHQIEINTFADRWVRCQRHLTLSVTYPPCEGVVGVRLPTRSEGSWFARSP